MEADRRRNEWVMGRCIGKGSFGTVSLACDKLDGGRVFAIKSVPIYPLASTNHHSISSIEKEIEILRSLRSPFIVSFLGDSTTLTHRNLHMEYVPGGTLADDAGNLDEHEVRTYARQIAHALFYLHTVAGVVHSDVKGRNVLAGPAPGAAKLADFGSARRISDQRGTIGGTPLWMAPEVIRGETPTPESDIWSLGCTVIEMITGGHPWKDNNNKTTTTLFDIGYSDKLPEFPSNLSKMGLDFLSKCLCRSPEERWTAEQLLKHPFLDDDDVKEIESGRSPRSVLEWANHEFNEDDEDEGNDDVMVLGRERIKQLAEDHDGENVIWESEIWETVRDFGGGIENCLREELGNLEEASGTALSNEMICSSSTTCSCFCDCNKSIGWQQVGRVMNEKSSRWCLDWGVFILLCCKVAGVNAIASPIFFTLVLHLFSLYRFVQLRFLNF